MRKVLALMMFAVLACGGVAMAGALGTVEIEPGQPIEIRAVLSDSVVPSVSRVLRTAIGIATEDFGPIRGHRVTVETLDEKCSPEGGRVAGKAVVAEAQVVGVIGTLCSAAAVETSPVLSAAGLSMISPSNTSPVLTSDLAGNADPDHHEGYYRVIGNDLIKGRVVARFSYDELGLRTMVTVHDGDPFTSALANAFADAFRERGGAVPVIAQVSKGQTDMAAALARFSKAGPDGVFIPLFAAEATALIRQADKLESLEGVARIGGAALMTTEILALSESEGFYFAAPHLGDSGNTNQAAGRSADEVRATFEEAFGGPPTSAYWAHGYDATTLLLSAIEEVSVVDGDTLRVDRGTLRDALARTAGFGGLLGTLTCDGFGDCGTGRSAIRFHEDSSVTDPSLLPIVYAGARESLLSR